LLGLYSDANEAALRPIVAFCRAHGQGETRNPARARGPQGVDGRALGREEIAPPEEGGWQPVAPSAIPMGEGELVPRALTRTEIQSLVAKFADSTRRAERIGFRCDRASFGHGYLMHEFLSPLSNGGATTSTAARSPTGCAFPWKSLPPCVRRGRKGKPLGVRISCTDWIEGGWTSRNPSCCPELKKLGCDWIDCSSGGLMNNQVIPIGPGYQVPFAERIREDAGMVTIAIGLITKRDKRRKSSPEARPIWSRSRAAFLWNPRWAWHAALELGATPRIPDQYLRGRPVGRAAVFGERQRSRA